jgi:Ca2+:H+ antiporter
MKIGSFLPVWTLIAPVAGWAAIGASWFHFSPGWYPFVLAGALLASVIVAVHHAELVAHRVGEPGGTLVLAAAITIIEVAMILTMMTAMGAEGSGLPRDTVLASVMIILNGIVGLCLVVGGAKFGEQSFRQFSANSSLATLAAIVGLTLVLPNYTTTAPGPVYSDSQLAFVAVVLLAEHLSPLVDRAVVGSGAPRATVGIIISAIVLLPEGTAALRAAARNRLQTSLNQALGSALASIGFTIPAVALVSLLKGWTLALGIDAKSTVLLLLSLFVSTLSLGMGRTTLLQGAVHLFIFAVYIFTAIVP